MNKHTYALFVLIFLAVVAACAVPLSVSAQRREDRIRICHATDSHTNPYTNPDVDPDAVDGDDGNDNGQGDHYLTHNGPVWFEGIADHSWGDIIPPIENVHQGKNWTEEGQRVHGNGCSFRFEQEPTPTPEATPSATPTATPSATPTQDPTPTPTPGDPGNGGGGSPTGGSSSSTPSTPAPQGEVLGATTYAATGVVEDIAANIAGLMGVVSMAMAWKTKQRSSR